MLKLLALKGDYDWQKLYCKMLKIFLNTTQKFYLKIPYRYKEKP